MPGLGGAREPQHGQGERAHDRSQRTTSLVGSTSATDHAAKRGHVHGYPTTFLRVMTSRSSASRATAILAVGASAGSDEATIATVRCGPSATNISGTRSNRASHQAQKPRLSISSPSVTRVGVLQYGHETLRSTSHMRPDTFDDRVEHRTVVLEISTPCS